MVPADRFSAEHRDLLLDLSLLISERRGVDEIYASFADHIRQGITFDFTSLFVVTADAGFLRSVGHYGGVHAQTATGTIHRAESMGLDRLSAQPYGDEYIPRRIDLEATQEMARNGFERAWVTALLVDGQTYGMLTVAKLARGAFPQDHLEFLRAAAALLAKAVRQDLELERARLNAARAQAASELIFAIQASEPFESIFKRLPALLEHGLEVDYVGLVIDNGAGFALGAEAPEGVHRGTPPTAEGSAFIRELAAENEFVQFRPQGGWSESLFGAGFKRGALSFLHDEEDLRGILMLARRSSRKFDDDERQFIALLKSILSQSLANQHRLQRTEAQAARARTLNEVALLLNAGEEISAIFQRLLGFLDEAMEIDYVGLLQATETPDTLVMVGSRPEVVRPAGTIVTAEELALPEIRSLGRNVAQYRVGNFAERTHFARVMGELDIRRSATVLIQQGGELQGVLSLARKNEERFTQDEEAFLETLSAMLGHAIANQRRLSSAQTEAARNGLLNELAVLLNNGEAPEAFFESLVTQMKTIVPFDGLTLLVSGQAPDTFRVVDSVRRKTFAPDRTANIADFGENVLQRLATGEVVIEANTLELGGKISQDVRKRGIIRGAVAAIQHSGENVGFFLLGRTEDTPFSAGECAFIELVCVLLGQVIANRRKVEEKEEAAIRAQVLSELAILLQGGDRIEEHFESLSEIMLQAVGFDFISVTTRDPASGEYRAIRSHALIDAGELLGFRPTAVDTIGRSGNSSVQYLTRGNPRPVPKAMFEAGFQRAASSTIVSPDGPQGILTIGRRDETPYSADEMAFIEFVSALVGQASANYLKAHAREAEALRSRILSELAVLLNNGEPIDAHFNRLRELLQEGVGFDYCSVAVRMPNEEKFRVMRSEPLVGDVRDTAVVNGSAIQGILAGGGFSSQYGQEAQSSGAPSGLFKIGINRGASFVLTTGAAPEGLLTIGRRSHEEFTRGEMAFFEVVGSLLAHAATNERRLLLTAQEAEDQATMAAAAAAVARETDALSIVRSLRSAVSRFLPSPFVSFGFLAGESIRFPGGDGAEVRLPIGPHFREALDRGQWVVVPSDTRGTRESVAELGRIGLQAHVLTRAQSAGVVVGVLVLGSRDPAFVPSSREERLCRLIADIVGPAMANAQNAKREREEAEDQAIVALAAAAVATSADAWSIANSLRDAVGRFMPDPFVRFAYRENDVLVFRTRDGRTDPQPMGKYFRDALELRQAVVPSLAVREAAGEVLTRTRAARLESHVLTRADSAGAVVGVLLLGSRDPAFAPEDRALGLCRMIAAIVGPAMANARAAERERAEAEDQAIIAEAASAVAREAGPLRIVRSLQKASARFLDEPFVSFGYLVDGQLQFRNNDNSRISMPIGPQLQDAIDGGQRVVFAEEAAIGSTASTAEIERTRLQGHILTLAQSASSAVGVLVVGSRNPAFIPGAREARLCRLIADIMGPAMANAMANERERDEAEDHAIIAAAAAAVARETSALEIVRGLRAAVARFIPSPFVNFGYLEADAVRFPSRTGRLELMAIDTHFRGALEDGQRIVPSTARRVSDGESTLGDMLELGIESHVLTRASSAGTTTGLLVVGSREPEFVPGARELRLCRLIADIVGPAMENARATLRTRLEAEEQRFLARAAAAVAGAKDEAALAEALSESFAGLLPEAVVSVFFREGHSDYLAGPGGRFRTTPQALRAFENGQSEGRIEDADLSEQSRTLIEREGLKRWIYTPTTSEGDASGLLWLATRHETYEFTDRDRRFCRLVADFVGPALANLREADRRRAEAEEQGILAEAAAAVARAADEGALVSGLRAPIRLFIPKSRIELFFHEQTHMSVYGSPGAFPIGPQMRRALAGEQVTGSFDDTEVIEKSREIMVSQGVRRYVDTPIVAGGDTLGVFLVATRDPNYEFTARDLRLLRLIAGFAGPAMANLRESARRKQEAEEQRILAETAAAVATSASEDELVATLQHPIQQLVPQGSLLFYYLDPEGFRVPGTQTVLPRRPQALAALENGQSFGETESADLEPEIRDSLRQRGIARWVYTSAKSGGDMLGVFLIATGDPDYRFGERDLRLFRLISDFAGPAMANLRESARRQEEAEEQRILAAAAAALAAGASEFELLQGLVNPIRSFVPRARVAFSYVEGDEMLLWDGRNRRPIHELSRRALDSGQIVGDVETSPMTEASRDLIQSAGVRRFADTAATSAGVAIGLLFVGSPEPEHEFSERDRRMLRLIADIAGPAMVNARDDRRRRHEAEDERILSEIAAVAARATTSVEIIECLPEALAPLIPEAFTLFGIIESDSVRYQVTREADRSILEADELTLPMTAVGRSARDTGQGVGSLAGLPPDVAYAAFGLHEYSLTCHYAAGAPIGVLLVSTTQPEFRFDERVLGLLKRVIQVVGPAVESSRAEAELARQSELYSLMLGSLSEGIVLANSDGQVVFANRFGRKILRAIDPTGSANSWAQVAEVLPEANREGYRAVFEHGVGSHGRMPLVIDERTAWLDYELVPLNDPVMKILIVAADVTAAVEREAEQTRHREQMEQASRLAALGELIGGVAHELNNPLTAILGFAEVMSLSPAATELSEELSILQKEALRARNIVRDLLFIVRPGTTERAMFPVGDLIDHIERLRRAAWNQQGIRWEINIEQPCMVWGNEHQLTQVLLNLVTNAEHALAGLPDRRITIRAVCLEQRTEISVADSGAGMDEATRSRVFEPFFTTKQGHGTGLGLPLSYSIVQAHDGEIRVDSKPGEGTTFTILLPSAPETPSAPPKSVRTASSGAIRVLVIDDEPSLRKVCQRLVSSMGHECTTAENSANAIELVSQTDFDVVLCDYRLGSETADDVVAGFERVAPHLISRIVIATGATTDAGVVELTERYGLPLMAKPYGVEELVAIIGRAEASAS